MVRSPRLIALFASAFSLVSLITVASSQGPRVILGPRIIKHTQKLQGKPYALNAYKKFRSSPLYQARLKKYPVPTFPTKVINYQDGHSLTIKMVPPDSSAASDIGITQKMSTTATTPGADGWVCTTSKIQFSANSSSYLNNDFSNSISHLYPGAMFTFDDFYSGRYRETPGARNPLTLSCEDPNISGPTSVTIPSPSMTSCRDAIATLYSRLPSNTTSYESIATDTYQSNNSADLNLQVSGGASGYGASFSTSFQLSDSSKSVALTIDARKTLYSISAQVPDTGYFKDQSIENTPNLMVLQNVSYGTRVLANVTLQFSSKKDALDFKAAYKGYGITFDAALSYLKTHTSTVSQAHIYVCGGTYQPSITTDATQVESEMNKALASGTNQSARPVSYQFMDMQGNLVLTQSATDTFSVVNCTPAGTDSDIQSARAHILQGSDGKNKDTDFQISLFPGQGDSGSVMTYNSVGHPEYKFDKNTAVDLVLKNTSATTPNLALFANAGGGHIQIYVDRHGHKDTWKITELTLFLTLGDGTVQQLVWPNIVLKENEPATELYFDQNFKPITN